MTPLYRLDRAQRDRIIETLLAGLDQVIQEHCIEEGLDALTLPEPEHYWSCESGQTGDLNLTGLVNVLVYPTKETVYPTRLSGNGLRGSALVETHLGIALLFANPAGYASVIRRGRELVESELISLYASIYKGALMEVLQRDAMDGEVILDLFPTKDLADSITTDELGTVGRALLEFKIKGQGYHPHPSYQLARQAP